MNRVSGSQSEIHRKSGRRKKRLDFLSVEKRSELMRRVKSTATSAEKLLIVALTSEGQKFETNATDLPGRPDIVYRRKRIAIFVDGDFWHGNQWRRRNLRSLEEQFPIASKRKLWITKINRNITRDFLQTSQLIALGWTVIRFWEHDISKNCERCVKLVRRALATKPHPSPASLIPVRTATEFFAGIGLARMGLSRAGWKVRFANDYCDDKRAIYKENFEVSRIQFEEGDIHDLHTREIPTASLATACFPCTDLSLAGSQRGLKRGTESSAYLKFTALLKEMGKRRPPFVLLENVVGMLHSRNGKDFRICLKQLAEAGYTVDTFILDAKSFVPHSRPRLFIVAIRDDLSLSDHKVAVRNVETTTLRPQHLVDFIKKNPELPWSLRSLPRPRVRKVRLKEVVQDLPSSDRRWWSNERAAKLYKQMSSAHRETVRRMMKSKRHQYCTVFRRMRYGASTAELRTDGIAGCLRTPKGGSARQILFRASKGRYAARLLTPRECARLMGAGKIRIPQGISDDTQLFAFGDGVCVPVVSWIARNYLNPVATELIRNRILRQPSWLTRKSKAKPLPQ